MLGTKLIHVELADFDLWPNGRCFPCFKNKFLKNCQLIDNKARYVIIVPCTFYIFADVNSEIRLYLRKYFCLEHNFTAPL